MITLRPIKLIFVLLTGIFLFGLNAYAITPMLYVDDDFNSSTPGWGVEKFDSIQEAVTNAADGYKIYVYAGEYYESVDVIGFTDLMIIGEGAGKTEKSVKLYPSSSENGFNVYSDGVNIAGFEIDGPDSGIDFSGDNNTFSNNYIHGANFCGIVMDFLETNDYDAADYTTITNNVFEDIFYDGIIIKPDYPAQECSINRNYFNNCGGDGVAIRNTSNSSINNNVITADGSPAALGIAILAVNGEACSHNDIMNNTINNCYYGIQLDAEDESAPMEYNTIGNNTVNTIFFGVIIGATNGLINFTKVIRNSINDAQYGISLGESVSYSKIHHNSGNVDPNNFVDDGFENDWFKNNWQ